MARGNFCWACAMLVVQVRVSIHSTALLQTVANRYTIRVFRPGIAQVCAAVYIVITTINIIRVLITQVFAALEFTITDTIFVHWPEVFFATCCA